MGAHTLGPIPVLTGNASTSFLARAQLSLKCPKNFSSHVPNLLPRWCHSSFNFCRLIPDVIWNFPYFSLLCPPNSNIPVSLTFACCLVSFMYQLCPSSPVGSWFHTAHSSIPRPCHSLIVSSLLYSQPCLRFPSPGFFSAIYILSLGDSVPGGNHN